jgi:hypothetical protein
MTSELLADVNWRCASKQTWVAASNCVFHWTKSDITQLEIATLFREG